MKTYASSVAVAAACFAVSCCRAEAQHAAFVSDPKVQQVLSDTVKELNSKLTRVRDGEQTFEYRRCPDGSIALDCTGHQSLQ